ncbi:pitrilysin family protein [Oscillatoria sp. FACHB-1406]|uniref:M16 family metallopeptidase n=1 Tax=Oscillatoria sp. FACHB-1406 TaxID=2692846 RepID=UPI001685D280|nr:pitrilysin family protein [Oscillatoria sp. FACHB-1406]MBD2576244.1 insulinase family protein [Oscillatoria sp. FACHB-1406]
MQKLSSRLRHSFVHRTVLDNGITLITVENNVADIIAARLFFKAGSCREPRSKAGLAHLLASTMTKGIPGLSATEIAEKIESIGASVGTDAAADYFVTSIKTVSADFSAILALVAAIVRSPTLPEREVELEQKLTLQSIRSQQEQPFNIAYHQLREAMYAEHPYGISSLGTEATVAQIARDDLAEYHQTYFRPDNLIISLSGRIAPEEAVELIDRVFGDWKAPETALPPLKLPSLTPNPSRHLKPQATQQAIVVLGYLTAAIASDDYIPLKLLSTYLGNGLSSRLFVELREKRGLAYDVSAFYPTRLDASQFVAYIGTAPNNSAIALQGLHAEIERLCHAPLSLEELQASKNKLLGQYALGKQTNAEIAQSYGWYETLGVGIEFDETFQEGVREVTPEIAQEVACRYFSPAPYISLVGPEEAIAQATL